MSIIKNDFEKATFNVNSPGFSKYKSMIQNMSISSREIIVWFRNKEDFDTEKFFWCNDTMSNKLGLTRNEEGLIVTKEYYELFVLDKEGNALIEDLRIASQKIRNDATCDKVSYIVKLRNKISKKLVYLHYILEIFERYPDGTIKSWGGNGIDVTDTYNTEAQTYKIKRMGFQEKINVSDILYVEVVNKKVFIETVSERYEISESFKSLSENFSRFEFILIYRGCIVNPKYIKRISNNQVTLDNGNSLPLSRYRTKEVKQELNQYRSKIQS